MNKLKLLILLIVSVACNQAFAGGGSVAPWCDSHVYVKAIGNGKVYVTGTASNQTVSNCTRTELYATVLGNSHNSDIFPAKTYLAAKPDDGWKFVKWVCTTKKGTYSTNGATDVNTTLDTALPKVQYAGVSKRGGSNTGADGESTTACTDTNAIWLAYFEQVVTQAVKVQSESSSLGTAVIDKSENNVGDEVTITAWCGNSNNSPRSETIMFLGWYRLNEATGEKEFVSCENPYTFSITNDNKGTYYARFASGYSFWRVKNNRYNNYLMARAKYTGTVSADPTVIRNALSTQLSFDQDLATATTDEGSMMKLWVSGKQPRTGKEVWDIYVQDEHTNQYYDDDAVNSGVFLQVTHQSDNTYIFNGNNNSFYLYENSSGGLTGGTQLLTSGYWQLEGMDKDLTTKENYFAVAPEKFVGPDADGYYWTTLRVCFNMLYETSEMTPFIVTAADASTGEMELTELTGGVIPEKTCVLLRCNSTDITRNVMIPTTATSSFNTSNNLLTSSTYYYKNQSVASSLNLKGIMIANGKIGFGGSKLTTVDGNRAYLSISGNVAVPDSYTDVALAELVQLQPSDTKYRITDLTAVDVVGGMIIAKDDNGSADRDEKTSDEWIDYMHTAGFSDAESYDQSNWIALRLPQGVTDVNSGLIGKHLTGVVGTLVNNVNPEFQLDAVPEADNETPANIQPNTYIPASFYGENNQIGTNGKTYFFVQPKPMELAIIKWAVSQGCEFVTIPKDVEHGMNMAGLKGSFEFNGEYLPNLALDWNHVYDMNALIKHYTSDYPPVYIMGNVNGLEFDSRKGVEMYTADGNTYTATVTVSNATNNENGFFGFTTRLGEYWDGVSGIAQYRFGAAENNKYVTTGSFSIVNGTNSFCILPGTYTMTVNLNANTLTISNSPAQAPRRIEVQGQDKYVVYPLTISETSNSVITGVTLLNGTRQVVGVEYYNLAGMRSDRPWQGVNIIVTRYTDGTMQTAKAVQ